ncbi:hypothetical protein BVC80_8755g21 [Macleaya cordata]|uniref:Uncharacterized protein n=1 Tax=Macleaya cordata TaxID=56857 RepID=A0A200PXQ1_MACCD|nr:hypothetical protein BVC80_8755g21 [Macleaya cordata]
MEPIIISHDLYSFIDPSFPIPPTHILDTTTNILNPNHIYNQWRKVDNTLLSWIRATLSESILSQLVTFKTSQEVWSYLEASFSSQNTARFFHLQNLLATIRKDNLSITDYLHKIKTTADSLASVLKPVSDLDLVSHALRGLGPDYESFTTAIYTRSVFPTFTELTALLLNQEARLEHLLHQQQTLPHSTAFVARSQSTNNTTNNNITTTTNNNPQGNRGRGQGGFSRFSKGRGSGRGHGSQNQFRSVLGAPPQHPDQQTTRPICQLCGKIGHVSARCFQRC